MKSSLILLMFLLLGIHAVIVNGTRRYHPIQSGSSPDQYHRQQNQHYNNVYEDYSNHYHAYYPFPITFVYGAIGPARG
ncbi:hypothetical protein OUZ56_022895 [Daphnia magna]|uniref:Uncharacterized protein n=1 Tax=Daphnia magna TaxID=35525 RepID=A0ABR0AY26_9CRUS|nr:hypothetical protein OUZ56_022895 [Daphnia magna]